MTRNVFIARHLAIACTVVLICSMPTRMGADERAAGNRQTGDEELKPLPVSTTAAPFSNLLKNTPSEGTGPAEQPGSRGIPVGRVPSRGALEVVQQAVGPFSIQDRGGRAWLVRPTGEPFFSLGVCCVNMGTPPEKLERGNPSYSAGQHYPEAARWAETTLSRLKTWGFTTVGGWSDFPTLKQGQGAHPDIVFTPVLHIGSTAGAPW